MKLTFLIFAFHVLDFIIAHPIYGNPAQNQRNCIRMTSQKEKELDSIVKKLAEFINTLHDEHEDFDITLLKLDIEQHIEDDEEEKDTILQITVNDCAETDGIHQDSSGNDKQSTKVHKKDFKDDTQNTKNSLETENISTAGYKNESPITESSKIKHDKIKKVDQNSLKNENNSFDDENEKTLKIEDLKAEKEKATNEIIDNEHLKEERETTGIEGDNDILGSSDASIRKNVRDQTVDVNPTNLRVKEDCDIVKTDKEESTDDSDEVVEKNKEHIGNNFVKVKDSDSQRYQVNESNIEISRENEVFKSEENHEAEEKAEGITVKNYDTEKDEVFQRNLKNKENFNTLDDQTKKTEDFLEGQSFKEDTNEEYKELRLRSDDLAQAVEEDLYSSDLLEKKEEDNSAREVSVLPEIMILELQDNGNKLLQELRKRRRKVTPFLVFVQQVLGKDEFLFL